MEGRIQEELEAVCDEVNLKVQVYLHNIQSNLKEKRTVHFKLKGNFV
jgi:hypothetical protein